MQRRQWFAVSVVLGLVVSAARAGNVFVVDPAHPPGTHPDIQSAIDAAADGDAVVIRSGTYARFDLPNRELSVVAEAGATVDVVGAPHLLALSAHRVLFMAGLRVTGANIGTIRSDGLFLQAAAGSVRFQDCSFSAQPGLPPAEICNQRRGAIVNLCADVAFTRCTLRGSSPLIFPHGKGGEGLSAAGSNIALYDCTVLGGNGGSAGYCDSIEAEQNNCIYGGYTIDGDGADGGPACKISGGQLMLSGCVIRGGDGGIVHPPPQVFLVGGCGGDGITTVGIVSIWGLASTPVGGVGQPGVPPTGQFDGLPGASVGPDPSIFTALAGTARSFRAPAIVREGAIIPLHLQGEPADRAGVLLDLDPVRIPALPFRGWYFVDPLWGSRFLRLGVLDGAGILDRDLVAPELAAGVFVQTLFLQTLHVNALGEHTLGPNGAVLVVDSSY